MSPQHQQQVAGIRAQRGRSRPPLPPADTGVRGEDQGPCRSRCRLSLAFRVWSIPSCRLREYQLFGGGVAVYAEQGMPLRRVTEPPGTVCRLSLDA